MNDRETPLTWTKSSRCSNGACIEVAAADGSYYVRDSKTHGTGPVLMFTAAEFASFRAAVAADEFRS